MRFYHRTTREAATEILAGGFKDSSDRYMTSHVHTGVWISSVPLDVNEGAWGDVLLAVDMPLELIQEYEWVEELKPYREFLVPASLVNTHAKVSVVEEDEKP